MELIGAIRLEAGWTTTPSKMWTERYKPAHRPRRLRVECGYPWQANQTVAEMVSDAIELSSDYRSFIEVDPAKRVTAANEQSGIQGAS